MKNISENERKKCVCVCKREEEKNCFTAAFAFRLFSRRRTLELIGYLYNKKLKKLNRVWGV